MEPNQTLPTPFKKVYDILINQSGTANPELTVLQNTIDDIVVTPARAGNGAYTLTITGATLPAAKTRVTLAPKAKLTGFSVLKMYYTLSGINISIIHIECWTGTGTTSDDILTDTSLKIELYDI